VAASLGLVLEVGLVDLEEQEAWDHDLMVSKLVGNYFSGLEDDWGEVRKVHIGLELSVETKTIPLERRVYCLREELKGVAYQAWQHVTSVGQDPQRSSGETR
jgi:hypothetical protein